MDESAQTSPRPRAARAGKVSTYFPWQIEMIRAALRAHKAYEQMPDGEWMSWDGVAIAIDEYTGVSITGEALRQFVEGVSKKKAPIRHRKLGEEHLQAIISYLCNPDIDALDHGELEEDKPDHHAAIRLLRYLRQELDDDLMKPSTILNGEYYEEIRSQGEIAASRLMLDVNPDVGVILVKEVQEIYGETGASEEVRVWHEDARSRAPRATIESNGWAIATPEDNLLFFMKEEPYLRNHYWSLIAECDFWSTASIDRLVFLRADYPAEMRQNTRAVSERWESLGIHKGVRI